MRRVAKNQIKRLVFKDIVRAGLCTCSVCSNQSIRVEDNFDKIGKENFVKLTMSALEASKPSNIKH